MKTEVEVKFWEEWMEVCQEFGVDPKTSTKIVAGSGPESLTIVYKGEEKPTS